MTDNMTTDDGNDEPGDVGTRHALLVAQDQQSTINFVLRVNEDGRNRGARLRAAHRGQPTAKGSRIKASRFLKKMDGANTLPDQVEARLNEPAFVDGLHAVVRHLARNSVNFQVLLEDVADGWLDLDSNPVEIHIGMGATAPFGDVSILGDA